MYDQKSIVIAIKSQIFANFENIKNIPMVGKYKVITLCGSTKFKEEYLEAQKRLTLEGNIVISVGLFGHSGDDEVRTEGTKACLTTCTNARSTWLTRSSSSMSADTSAKAPAAKSPTPSLRELM